MAMSNPKKVLFVCLGKLFCSTHRSHRHIDPLRFNTVLFLLINNCPLNIRGIGNICRSPIAEAVFIDTVLKQDLVNQFEIDSAAIGSWHVGRNPDNRALSTMKKHNLAYSNKARQVC